MSGTALILKGLQNKLMTNVLYIWNIMVKCEINKSTKMTQLSAWCQWNGLSKFKMTVRISF